MVDQTQLSGDNLQVTVYEVTINLLHCIGLLLETIYSYALYTQLESLCIISGSFVGVVNL